MVVIQKINGRISQMPGVFGHSEKKRNHFPIANY
jgi:hypothetical protein